MSYLCIGSNFKSVQIMAGSKPKLDRRQVALFFLKKEGVLLSIDLPFSLASVPSSVRQYKGNQNNLEKQIYKKKDFTNETPITI